MTEKIYRITGGFTPSDEGKKLIAGVSINFYVHDQYFPSKVKDYIKSDSDCDKNEVSLEVMINNPDIVLKECTSFSLKKGPLFHLGTGIIRDVTLISSSDSKN